MYQIGDLVVYCSHGVCRIEDVQERTVDKKQVSYYVLSPQEGSKTQFFVPTHNPAALAKMRNLHSREALLQILQDVAACEDCWIPEENRRKQRYKELTGSVDFAALAQMVHTLQQRRQMQLQAGKKFHLSDETFLREAKKQLQSEIRHVFSMEDPQLPQEILPLLER